VIATDSAGAGSLVSDQLMEVGTARLLPVTGLYTLQVRAYVDPNNQTVIPPGDLKFTYKVEVIIVPLQDPKEPNNSIEDAKAKPSPDLTIGAGGSGNITDGSASCPTPTGTGCGSPGPRPSRTSCTTRSRPRTCRRASRRCPAGRIATST
jgi:hypothetical protein